MPRFIIDPVMGHVEMRNRWKDKDDIIVTALFDARHDKIEQRIVVWGLGRRFTFGAFGPTRVTFSRGAADGSGVVCADGLARLAR